MTRYAMVIDLERCYGCDACVLACRDEFCLPDPVRWARVLKGEIPGRDERIPLPIFCMQCREPSCMRACDADAITIRGDGIVTVDEDLCVGCGACVTACPYGAMASSTDITPQAPSPMMNQRERTAFYKWEKRAKQGAATKCTFCEHRLAKGRLPACVAICPVHAHVFGDLDDPKSEVSDLVAKRHPEMIHPEWGTLPRVFYIPPKGMRFSEVLRIVGPLNVQIDEDSERG